MYYIHKYEVDIHKFGIILKLSLRTMFLDSLYIAQISSKEYKKINDFHLHVFNLGPDRRKYRFGSGKSSITASSELMTVCDTTLNFGCFGANSL